MNLSTRDSWYQILFVWEIIIASSVTEVSIPQQGGKKGNDKNKDVMALVEEKLGDATMTALTGRVEDMDQCIEQFESIKDM